MAVKCIGCMSEAAWAACCRELLRAGGAAPEDIAPRHLPPPAPARQDPLVCRHLRCRRLLCSHPPAPRHVPACWVSLDERSESFWTAPKLHNTYTVFFILRSLLREDCQHPALEIFQLAFLSNSKRNTRKNGRKNLVKRASCE
jgi:hypothetical protein